MKVVAPITFVDFTTTIPENDAPKYNESTSYAVDYVVMYDHATWKSMADVNIGNIPSDESTSWLKVGATNAYKCIDDVVSSKSVSNGGVVTITFKSRRATKLALLNTKCKRVTMTQVLNGKNVVPAQTVDGFYRNSEGWFKYFSSAFNTKTFFVFDLGFSYGATVTLTFEPDDSTPNVAIGIIVLGTVEEIGDIKYGVQGGFYDYSKINTDEDGVTTVKVGNFAQKFSGTVSVPSKSLSTVQKILIDRRGKPSLYMANDDNTDVNNELLSVFGLVNDFTPVLNGPVMSECSLFIKGVI